jgi:hypothetical protein
MQEATTSSAPGSVARAHRIAADVATDLGGYGDILQEELPVLEQASDQMIESGLKWLTAAGADQQAEDLEGFRVALATNYVVIAEALVSTREYRESFHSVRGVTSQLNKSSDRVVSLLGRLLTVMEKTQSFANRGSDIAQEILDADALHVVVEPGLRCFADAAGAEPQPFEAVLLATFDRGVVERALPYLGTKFQKHGLVSWAIDDKEVFPESWFVHPFTGQLEHGWDEAPAFVGGEIELKEES